MAEQSYAVARAYTPKRGDLVSLPDGRPYLVWGVAGASVSLMPARCNGLGVGSVNIEGRVRLDSHDPADIFWIDTLPRRHLHASQIDKIGRVAPETIADVAAEIDRQRLEQDARSHGGGGFCTRFRPLRECRA